MIPQGFVRVTKSHPCPVCKKPDWCLVAKDGSAAICPRVPSQRLLGEAGYLHRLTDAAPAYLPSQPPKRVTIDADAISRQYQGAMSPGDYVYLSESLGLTAPSLDGLGVGRAVQYLDGTYSFPMRDASDRIIGVRLRSACGHKWAVYGSRSGLFYGSMEPGCDLYVCEGPTDTAALMDIGFCAVGKPSCSSGNDMLVELVRKVRPRMVVVVSDVDDKGKPCDFCEKQLCMHCRPGQYGAIKTCEAIAVLKVPVKLIEPIGAKDARAWKLKGAKHRTITAIVDNTPCWTLK